MARECATSAADGHETGRPVLAIDGISRPIVIEDEALSRGLRAALRGWRLRRVEGPPQTPPAMSVSVTADGYAVASPWREGAAIYHDRVDALCALIADIIRTYLAEHETMLCLHCAAVEFTDRIVAFPSPYRAGKSTIMAQLAAMDVRLFADDVLPIAAPYTDGFAPGIAPRSRIPLYADASDELHDFKDRHLGPANHRYAYLNLDDELLAPFAHTAPIRAFVTLDRRDATLDRRDAGAARLVPVGASTMLRQVIVRNFSRRVPAPDVLRRLLAIVAQARCFTLQYADAADGAAVLKDAFADPTRLPRPRHEAPTGMDTAGAPANGARQSTQGHRRHPMAIETAVESEAFIVNPQTEAIFALNAIGNAVWNLLREPCTVREASHLVRAAFPDIAAATVERDFSKLFADLSRQGLII